MVHQLIDVTDPVQAGPVRVGLVVSKAVGTAVTRNLVKRRIRHLALARLADLPPGSVLVIRALPAAATATYAGLGEELDRALDRLTRALNASRDLNRAG